MLKTSTIVATLALVAILPSAAFAQMENGMGGDSMSKGSMSGMKSKSMMMKKHKMMHHHTMHHSMMKKPMGNM